MKIPTLALVALVAMSAAGCDGLGRQSTRVALAECRMNAARVYPRWDSGDPALETGAADFAYFCMQAKGFVFDGLGTKQCPYKAGVIAQVAFECYRRPSFAESMDP